MKWPRKLGIQNKMKNMVLVSLDGPQKPVSWTRMCMLRAAFNAWYAFMLHLLCACCDGHDDGAVNR